MIWLEAKGGQSPLSLVMQKSQKGKLQTFLGLDLGKRSGACSMWELYQRHTATVVYGIRDLGKEQKQVRLWERLWSPICRFEKSHSPACLKQWFSADDRWTCGATEWSWWKVCKMTFLHSLLFICSLSRFYWWTWIWKNRYMWSRETRDMVESGDSAHLCLIMFLRVICPFGQL